MLLICYAVEAFVRGKMTSIVVGSAVAKVSLLVFAILVAGGGVMGFVKAQSKPSLIAGVTSGIILGVCYFVSNDHPQTGLTAGLVVAILLAGVFGMRFAKSKSFMPAGLMIVLSIVESILLLAGLDWSSGIHFD